MPGSPALAFGALVAGAIIIDYGVKNARGAFNSIGQNGTGTASGASGVTKVVGTFPASVNPLPDTTGSRLDQGIDGTGKTFLSPWSGTVVKSNVHDPGWKGGGYVAIESSDDPSFVYYLAEGIAPVVHAGETVTAGQRIAFPIASPYNNIVGNIEAGLADPASPGRPLAQVSSTARAEVIQFADWLAGLGGPKPTSTGNAGRA